MRSDKILDSNVMHISKPILIFSAEKWKTNIIIEISNIDLPNWGQKISKKWKSIFPQKSHKGPPFGFMHVTNLPHAMLIGLEKFLPYEKA